MKKGLLTMLALAMLAGCSSANTGTETPVATVEPTATPEVVDVLTAYRNAWQNAAMSEHQLLLDYMGKKELFPILSVEDIQTYITENSSCEGIDQADIDADVTERSESLTTLYEELTNFVMNTELVEVEEQKLTDSDMLFRMDIKSSEYGRYSFAFYNGGYICVRQVLPLMTGWYQIDEAAVSALKDVVDNGYVLITEENAERLTCWEADKLAALLAA